MAGPKRILTGVHNVNSVEYLDDILSGIDLDLEEYLQEHPNQNIPEEWEQGDTLIGYWANRDELWKPQRGKEYAAIYRPDFNVIQVVASQYAIQCNICSPCFPKQGDVDTPGPLWAFSLPPDVMQREWLLENYARMWERYETTRGNWNWRRSKAAAAAVGVA